MLIMFSFQNTAVWYSGCGEKPYNVADLIIWNRVPALDGAEQSVSSVGRFAPGERYLVTGLNVVTKRTVRTPA
jgi:hypothetical protein